MVTRLKLSGADPDILANHSGSGVGVEVGVPNEMHLALSSSDKSIAGWVRNNVTRYFPTTSSVGGGGGVRIE